MSYNQRDSKHMTEHPFHPKGGQAAKPMRSYESIKRELEGKAKSETKAHTKKKELAKKMSKNPTKGFEREIARDKRINKGHAEGKSFPGDIGYGK